MDPKGRTIFAVFRALVGVFLFIHGVARVLNHGVTPFGEFLSGQHFPLGLATAWLITIVELVGPVALALGYFVILLSLWFAFELLMGIVLVHGKNGWFVVGGGFNGAEYSVLLILCFLFMAAVQWRLLKESRRLL
jgi:putative oxidoreductase